MGCKKAGALCGSKPSASPDRGTIDKRKNVPPGTLDGYVSKFMDEVVDVSAHVPKIIKWMILSALEEGGFKSDAPSTIRFFKHYLAGSGELLELDPVPIPWQEAIAKHMVGKSGKLNVNPYNWGVFDIQNSLGHFDLTITAQNDGSRTYLIEDFYTFPYVDDNKMPMRHGFEIDAETAQRLKPVLPTRTFALGHRFEVVTLSKTTYLYLPTEWLQMNGIAFKVSGSFNDADTPIDKHTNMVGVLDDAGLADELVKLGNGSNRIQLVLLHLEMRKPNDDDNVARAYIRLMIAGGKGKILKGMPKVVSQLRSSLNSGWVSKEDEDAIKALDNL